MYMYLSARLLSHVYSKLLYNANKVHTFFRTISIYKYIEKNFVPKVTTTTGILLFSTRSGRANIFSMSKHTSYF